MYSEKNHPHGYFDGFNIKAISLDNGKQRDAGWYVLDEHEICNEQTPVYANGSLFWWTTFTSWKYRIFSELPSQILACDLHTKFSMGINTGMLHPLHSWSANVEPK